MPRRSLVLIKLEDPADPVSPSVPLGSFDEFVEAVAVFNTAEDGSERSGPTAFLHGPGMVIELLAGQNEVRQAQISCTDQDTAWPVLYGMCQAYGWKLQDIETGRTFG